MPAPLDILATAPAASDAIASFYRAVATASFTLLGLWWIVVQSRYGRGEGAGVARRHAYGIALFFLLPGIMGLIASINAEVSLLWRIAFGACAAIGMLEVGLYLATGGVRSAPAVGLRACGLALYALILALAIHPPIAPDAGLGLRPQEAESILLGLLLFVGANLVWLGLTEPVEAAGA
jgi:hypothetical protein